MPRSLAKRAIDTMIEQLLERIGDGAHVLGPGARVSVLDTVYVGTVKELLHLSFPGVPDEGLSELRSDLIVVRRGREAPSELVGLEPSVLRVSKANASSVDDLQQSVGDLLNVTVQPTRYLDTDWKGPQLTFDARFFVPRSIASWIKLSRHFARVCAAMGELKDRSGLAQRNVFHEGRDTQLIPATIVDARGEPLELARA
jgi:hypothetical protein